MEEKTENFQDGDKVYLKPDYADKLGEKFTLSIQSKGKMWIGDKNDNGWYVFASQITKKNPKK